MASSALRIASVASPVSSGTTTEAERGRDGEPLAAFGECLGCCLLHLVLPGRARDDAELVAARAVGRAVEGCDRFSQGAT